MTTISFNNKKSNNHFFLRIKKKPIQIILISFFIIIFLFFYILGNYRNSNIDNNNINSNKINNDNNNINSNKSNINSNFEDNNNNNNNNNNNSDDDIYDDIEDDDKKLKLANKKIKLIQENEIKATYESESFAYQAFNDIENFDISIFTQLSTDKIEKLSLLADIWRAPISASIFIKQKKDIDLVFKLVRNSVAVSQFVDIHFLYSNHTSNNLYPINSLRNLALKNTRTDWVLSIDIDYIPSYDMYNYLESILIKNNNNQYKSLKSGGGNVDNSSSNKIAYIIPMFETGTSSSTTTFNEFNLPENKIELIKNYHKENIKVVESKICIDCISPTNYNQWFELIDARGSGANNSPYRIDYQWLYDPFLLFNKLEFDFDQLYYDERLKSLITIPNYSFSTNVKLFKSTLNGLDKISHTFSMATQGFTFLVLPNAWFINIQQPDNQQHSLPTSNKNTLDQGEIENFYKKQMFLHSYNLVCSEILPDLKIINNHTPDTRLFDEPLQDECKSKYKN